MMDEDSSIGSFHSDNDSESSSDASPSPNRLTSPRTSRPLLRNRKQVNYKLPDDDDDEDDAEYTDEEEQEEEEEEEEERESHESVVQFESKASFQEYIQRVVNMEMEPFNFAENSAIDWFIRTNLENHTRKWIQVKIEHRNPKEYANFFKKLHLVSNFKQHKGHDWCLDPTAAQFFHTFAAYQMFLAPLIEQKKQQFQTRETHIPIGSSQTSTPSRVDHLRLANHEPVVDLNKSTNTVQQLQQNGREQEYSRPHKPDQQSSISNNRRPSPTHHMAGSVAIQHSFANVVETPKSSTAHQAINNTQSLMRHKVLTPKHVPDQPPRIANNPSPTTEPIEILEDEEPPQQSRKHLLAVYEDQSRQKKAKSNELNLYTMMPDNWPNEVQWKPTIQPPFAIQVPKDNVHDVQKINKANPYVTVKKIENTRHPCRGQYGVFAKKPIEKGTFLCEYTGDIVQHISTSTGVDTLNGRGNQYNFSYCIPGHPDLLIDAKKSGNESRYVNDFQGVEDACVNASFEQLMGDDGIIHVVLIATMAIQQGREILVTYGKNYNLGPEIPEIPRERVEVVGPLGKRGSAGAVYKARWDGNTVAIKSYHSKEFFYREQWFLSSFAHPCIVTAYGYIADFQVGGDGPTWALVLEYAQLGSLDDFVKKYRSIPFFERTIVSLLLNVCSAMCHLHHDKTKPFMHRDLKPQNIVIFGTVVENNDFPSFYGLTAKVCDFDAGKFEADSNMTVIGTNHFMAPEIKFGKGGHSKKVDVYSFGVTIKYVMASYNHSLEQDRFPSNVPIESIDLTPQAPSEELKLAVRRRWAKWQNLATDCCQQDPEKRPEFRKIMEMLQEWHNDHLLELGGALS